MRIEHIALWVKELESMKDFYVKYFNVTPSVLYHNFNTGFKSYFLSFTDGSRLEIMTRESIDKQRSANTTGYVHIAISVGSREKVEELTERFRQDGYSIKSAPRVTGDGYYESVILDPENNELELTV